MLRASFTDGGSDCQKLANHKVSIGEILTRCFLHELKTGLDVRKVEMASREILFHLGTSGDFLRTIVTNESFALQDTRSRARVMLVLGARAGLAPRRAPLRAEGDTACARCAAASTPRASRTKPCLSPHPSITRHLSTHRRLTASHATGNNSPGGFGNFGDFDRVGLNSSGREGTGDETGGNEQGDDPTTSGDFSPSKFSKELSKRNMASGKDEYLVESSDKQKITPFGSLQARDDIIDTKSSGGLLANITAERNRPLLINALVKTFGPSGQYVFAFLLAVGIWYAPKMLSILFTITAHYVPLVQSLGNAFQTLTHLGIGFDTKVASACTAATFKIVVLCLVIAKLMKTETLTKETPVVLSKLAFAVCLPTYMCTRVAITLNTTPLTLGLAILPVCAAAQVMVGGAIGLCVSTLCKSIPGFVTQAWHGVLSPSESQRKIGKSIEHALNVPGVGGALVPGGGETETFETDDKSVPFQNLLEKKRDPMDRLAIACCAFGNTFTLPLVFLVEVLGAAYGDRVAGYIALYLVGWSPTLWTFGYILITGAADSNDSNDKTKKSKLDTVRFIAKEVCNPPLMGICLGFLIGVTPLRHILIGGGAGSTVLSSFPPELSIIFASMKCLFELAFLVGGAALPVQTLILASSFVKLPSKVDSEKLTDETHLTGERNGTLKQSAVSTVPMASSTFGVRFRNTNGAAGAVLGGTKKFFTGIKQLFAVEESADVRALLVASSVRFFLLPLIGVLGCLALRAANSPWYPSDPVVAMVGLTMSAMPPAQNLVLLTNLNEKTRHLAPRIGGLLVRMYILAVVPCTVWLTVFKAAVA